LRSINEGRSRAGGHAEKENCPITNCVHDHSPFTNSN
jgi:hypothetical protein